MPIATAPSAVPTRPSAVAKMEDRKRPAIADTDEYAPPSKRQAMNGGASKVKEDPNGEHHDEAWLEVSPYCPPSHDNTRHVTSPSHSTVFLSGSLDIHDAFMLDASPSLSRRAPHLVVVDSTSLLDLPLSFSSMPRAYVAHRHHAPLYIPSTFVTIRWTVANSFLSIIGLPEGCHHPPDERIQERKCHIRSKD